MQCVCAASTFAIDAISPKNAYQYMQICENRLRANSILQELNFENFETAKFTP